MNVNINVFERNKHKIILGDVLESLKSLIPDSSIDLIFADPPYNIGKDFNGRKDKWESDEAYLDWCYQWLELCVQKLKPNGSFYVMTSYKGEELRREPRSYEKVDLAVCRRAMFCEANAVSLYHSQA